MREIKFDFIYKGETGFHHKQYYLSELVRKSLAELSDFHHCMELVATRQFTGLRDKNGKEIYEKDIVSGHYFWFDGNPCADREFTGVVEMVDFKWGVRFKDRHGDDCFIPFADTSHFEEPCIEVLGNAFETPELLEAK